MTTGETEAFATRLPAAEATRVREAIDETDLSKSDLLARALRYYVEQNPDEIPAFRPNAQATGPLEEIGILLPETERDRTPSEEP